MNSLLKLLTNFTVHNPPSLLGNCGRAKARKDVGSFLALFGRPRSVGVAHESPSTPVVAATAPLCRGRVGSQTACLPVLLRPTPPARAIPLPPLQHVPDTHGPCLAPFRNCVQSAAARTPTRTVTAFAFDRIPHSALAAYASR